MTTQEFSNEFDTLLNSFSVQNTFGEQSSKFDLVLDEYEKSILLTQAQEEIIKGLYNGTLTGKSFESTEELRRYLDSLLKTKKLEPSKEKFVGVTPNSQFYIFPEDAWFITYEQATITDLSSHNGKTIVKVIPMRQDEWHKSSNNPFRKPNKNKIIRLDFSSEILELISDYLISDYLIKYISKPTPIILTQLPDDLSINGEQNITECKLNTALHRVILERAVQLAYRRFPKQTNNNNV